MWPGRKTLGGPTVLQSSRERNQIALWLAVVLVLSAFAIYLPRHIVEAASPAKRIEAQVMANIASGPPVMAAAAPAGAAGVGLVDPTTGIWHLRNRNGDPAVFYYGNPGDYPMMGDWNCDGIDTPGLYRQSDGFVYLRNSNSQGIANIRFFFGNPGDIPLAGDFNGNGCDTVSIYRPSEGRVFIINKLGQNEGGLGAAEYSYYFGNPGDKPFVGDFNGDGIDTVGLHRESTGFVYFRNSNTQGFAEFQFFFGDPGDRLVAGDWTGDGKDTPALFRPSNRTIYLRYTNTAGFADESYTWGNSPYVPVSGNFGTLSSGVNVNLFGAPDALEHAVESFYQEYGFAPHLPNGLRSHLSGIGDAPKSKSVTGSAAVDKAYGKHVSVITTGGDTLLAVSNNGWQWRIVGAHVASQNRARWFGNEPRHVVLLGTDWQKNSNGTWPTDVTKTNSDSVHILSLSPSRGRGTLTGIPRDTWVSASYGTDKIAITTRNRGPHEAVTALKNESGLPLEGYLHTGMGTAYGQGGIPVGFSDLVDAYGGFPFVVPYDALGGVAKVGDTFVNGAKALAFARERSTLPHGDVDRTLAHGLLFKAALADVRKSSILTIPALLALMDGYVNTNLSVDSLLTLAAATYVTNPGSMPTLTAQDLADHDHSPNSGWGNIGETHVPYNQNVGGLPNVMMKGCELILNGTFGWDFNSGNYGTFSDLSDGLLSTNPPYYCP